MSGPFKVIVADPLIEQTSASITEEWLVGFIDGEGSFNICGHGGSLQPRFRLNQRDDDGDLVRAIHGFLGVGSVNKKLQPHQVNAKPQLIVNVAGRDCVRIVEIIDRVPLLSKKRFEYPIWKKAVWIYRDLLGQRWLAPQNVAKRTLLLEPLKVQLESQRLYRGRR